MKCRLYYTPRQLNELTHETKSLGEVFAASLTAAIVAAMVAWVGACQRPVAILGASRGAPLFGGITYLLLFVIGASAQYAVIKSPVPDTASPVHGYSRWGLSISS